VCVHASTLHTCIYVCRSILHTCMHVHIYISYGYTPKISKCYFWGWFGIGCPPRGAYIYVYMYVRTYISKSHLGPMRIRLGHTLQSIYIYVRACISICTYTYTRMHVCTHAHVCIYTNICVYRRTCAGWQRLIGCLLFRGHFPREEHYN